MNWCCRQDQEACTYYREENRGPEAVGDDDEGLGELGELGEIVRDLEGDRDKGEGLEDHSANLQSLEDVGDGEEGLEERDKDLGISKMMKMILRVSKTPILVLEGLAEAWRFLGSWSQQTTALRDISALWNEGLTIIPAART